MITKKNVGLFISLLMIMIPVHAQEKKVDIIDTLILEGEYFGQITPGIIPELFAPGIVSRSDYFEHSSALFTPDKKEVFWTAKSNNQRDYKIYCMKSVNGIWSHPKVADFCLENMYYQNCIMASDGQKLYFTDGDNWFFIEKQNGSWSTPNDVSLKMAFASDINICSVTNSGSIYFIKRPDYDVYIAKNENGNYDTPEKLCENINSADTRENSVYVSPDENYMIIEATRDRATCELFVSFRKQDNSWAERKKLPIEWGRFPSVSPDGRFLFFMTREGIYWVSTIIIDELKDKSYKN